MSSLFTIKPTKKFFICDIVTTGVEDGGSDVRVLVVCDLNCEYSQSILRNTIAKRKWCKGYLDIPPGNITKQVIQFRDFENIEWEKVMSGEHVASSYLIRKGMDNRVHYYIVKSRTKIVFYVCRTLSKSATEYTTKAIFQQAQVAVFCQFSYDNHRRHLERLR